MQAIGSNSTIMQIHTCTWAKWTCKLVELITDIRNKEWYNEKGNAYIHIYIHVHTNSTSTFWTNSSSPRITSSTKMLIINGLVVFLFSAFTNTSIMFSGFNYKANISLKPVVPTNPSEYMYLSKTSMNDCWKYCLPLLLNIGRALNKENYLPYLQWMCTVI